MGIILAIQSLWEMTEDMRYLHEVKQEQKRSLWWLVLVSVFHVEWSFLTLQEPQIPKGGREGTEPRCPVLHLYLLLSFLPICPCPYIEQTGMYWMSCQFWLMTQSD